MNIHFEKVTRAHLDTIFSWLAEPHIREFWDNSQEHKDDILNFIQGKPQTYFAGTTQYWIGLINNQPYAFVLSDILKKIKQTFQKRTLQTCLKQDIQSRSILV